MMKATILLKYRITMMTNPSIKYFDISKVKA